MNLVTSFLTDDTEQRTALNNGRGKSSGCLGGTCRKSPERKHQTTQYLTDKLHQPRTNMAAPMHWDGHVTKFEY